jgi:predicted nucleic acid-binding Zn ribbon protein
MPIIEFKCPKHGTFELILFGESVKMQSTVCQHARCHRVANRVDFSTTQVRFKGAGFYNTTYQRSEAVDRAVEQAGE